MTLSCKMRFVITSVAVLWGTNDTLIINNWSYADWITWQKQVPLFIVTIWESTVHLITLPVNLGKLARYCGTCDGVQMHFHYQFWPVQTGVMDEHHCDLVLFAQGHWSIMFVKKSNQTPLSCTTLISYVVYFLSAFFLNIKWKKALDNACFKSKMWVWL